MRQDRPGHSSRKQSFVMLRMITFTSVLWVLSIGISLLRKREMPAYPWKSKTVGGCAKLPSVRGRKSAISCLRSSPPASGEDVKVVQKWLCPRSARITMDVLCQGDDADQSQAQEKVVAMMRDIEKPSGELLCPLLCSPEKGRLLSKFFILLASPTGFEPVLPP